MKITIQTRIAEESFACETGEMILHAGLRQGINLPYECATGTCGTCRARVVSGDVDVRWREAPAAAKLKIDKGDILMCQTRALSDCVLRAPSGSSLALKHNPAARKGVLRNVRKLTKDVAHFDVHLSAPMSFEAGQFVVIETPDLAGGRAYSMVNFEQAVDRIALVLKRKPGGRFSDWLFGEQPGDPEVQVFGPLGRAIFRPQDDKNIICLAGGSGIAGMMSILECAVQADYFRNHKGTVFFGVRAAQDMFYLDALSRLAAAAYGNLEITIALSDEAAVTPSPADFPNLKLASGMVHEVASRAMAGLVDNAIAFVAGPPIMVDAAIRALIMGGLTPGDIRYDKFS